MQSANGGWGAFDVDNDAYWLYEIPFCDFGAVIDPPSVDVTAHVVELLAREEGYEEAVRRGDRLPARASRRTTAPGSGAGASTTSTGSARRCRRSRPPACRTSTRRSAVRSRWLEAHQNEDGGFGEDCRSYDRGEDGDRLARPRRVDAVADRLGADRARCRRRGGLGLRHAGRRLALRGTSSEDGDWDEEHFTGTGFPRDFLIRYHLYRIVWPIIALGRVSRALAA